MKCLVGPRTDGVCHVLGSPHIHSTIKEAVDIASTWDITVRFEFNDVMVIVKADSDAKLIERDFNRALDGCISRHVGPHPKQDLSDVEKMEDEIIRAIMKRRRNEAFRKQFETKPV